MVKFLDTVISDVIGYAHRHAKSVVLIYGLLLIASVVACLQWLSVNTDSSKMLSSRLAFQQRTHALNEAFPSLKNAIILVVRSDIADAADSLTQQLVRNLAQDSAVKDVFAPAIDPFFLRNGLLYQSTEELQENLDRLNKSASLLARLRSDQTLSNFWHSLLTAEELGANADFDLSFLDEFYADVARTIKARLAGGFMPLSWAQASEGTVETGQIQRIVYVTPALDFMALQPAKASIAAIDKALTEVDRDLKKVVSVGVTGDPVLRFQELKSVSNGIGLSLLLSLLLVAVLLWIAFRALSHVVVTMTALICALVMTTGFAAAAFGALNLVSVAFVVLLVGLGLDFSIHVLAHLGDEKTDNLKDKLTGIGRGIGGALALSCLTTAIAFLSFVPTDFIGMAQLGGLGAVGVIVAFVVSITLVPALITLIPWFHKHLIQKQLRSSVGGKLAILFMPDLRKNLALVLTGALLIASPFAFNVRFDADPIALRDPESSSMQALALLSERKETVPYRLSLLRSSEEEAVQAARTVEALSVVHQANTLASLVPDDQDEKFEILDFSFPTFETIVEGEGLEPVEIAEGQLPREVLIERLTTFKERSAATELAAILKSLEGLSETKLKEIERDIFLFFPDLISRIDAQLGIDTVTIDTLPAALKDRYLSKEGIWRVDVTPSGDINDPAALFAFVSQVEKLDGEASGAPLQVVNAGKTVSGAIVQSLLIAGLCILVLAFLVLLKVTTVIAIFVPLLMAGAFTAAASALLDIPFNYANVIVLPLLIGLGVDSGIHIAMRRDKAKDSRALYTSSTPRAVLFSGLTTIAAFATLSVSDHRGTASMGQMLAIAISATLICTILITPVLMDILSGKENERLKSDKIHS